MTQSINITRPKVKKLIETVDAGLCNGIGEPIPGQMCVEAAVCYALDLPHGDDPKCVSSVLRRFKITLNDSSWSSNQSRSKGLRKLAVLQLGTDVAFDAQYFTEQLVIRLVNEIISELPNLPDEVRDQCRMAKTLKECKAAAKAATAYSADYAADAAAYAAAYAADYAAYAAKAADAADYAAYAAKAADAAAKAAAKKDGVLSQMAAIAEEILIEMKVPGVKYLDLLEV